MRLLDALRYAWKVGLPIADHGERKKDRAWDGRRYDAARIDESNRAIRLLVHDTNHYRVASPAQRRLAEYGLGTAVDGDYASRRVPDDVAHDQEDLTTALDVLVLAKLGDSAENIIRWWGDGIPGLGTPPKKTARRLWKQLYSSGILAPGEFAPQVREVLEIL